MKGADHQNGDYTHKEEDLSSKNMISKGYLRTTALAKTRVLPEVSIAETIILLTNSIKAVS